MAHALVECRVGTHADANYFSAQKESFWANVYGEVRETGNCLNISFASCCIEATMIRTHYQQPTLWTGFLKEEVSDL